MSRFFRGDSDSEDEDSGVEEVEVKAKPKAVSKSTHLGAASFEFVESDESEDEGRQIKSRKAKLLEPVEKQATKLRNSAKIGNWKDAWAAFKDLTALVEGSETDKSKKPMAKADIPKFYYRDLIDLESAVQEAWAKKSSIKQKDQATSLTTLRQKLGKLMQARAEDLEAYKKDPLADDDEVAKPKKAEKKTAVVKRRAKVEESEEEEEEEDDDEEEEEEEDDDEEEEEEDEDEDEEEEEEESEEEEEEEESEEESDDEDEDEVSDDDDEDIEAFEATASKGPWFSRDFWVKKPMTEEQKAREEKREAEKAARKAQAAAAKREQKQKDREEREKRQGEAKEGRQRQEVTPEMVAKKLKELIALRGKRGTDRAQLVDDLKYLATKTTVPVTLLKVKCFLVAALFDVSAGGVMELRNWKDAHDNLTDMLEILQANPNVRLSEDENVTEEAEEPTEEEKKEAEAKGEPEPAAPSGPQYVFGSLGNFLQRLSDDFRKALQNADAHSEDYIKWLKVETALEKLIVRVRQHYAGMEKLALETRMVQMHLELVYYHYVPQQDLLRPADAKDTFPARLAPGLVATLCSFLYKHGDKIARTRAVLCQVYHLALHNHFQEARDLMLMSHLQEHIGEADVDSRLLFNRAMAVIGLAAFRVGETRQVLDCLGELFQSGRIKELLGQGITAARYAERDEKQEKKERERQYPYHQHINLDMLEGVHLVSAMLVEVPNLAVHGVSNKRRIISKVFRRLFDYYQRQAFTGPPESTRDLVMAASKAMQTGDWEKCLSYVFRLRLWEHIKNADVVKAPLKVRIQEEALRTYLITYGGHYATLSSQTLCDMFALDRSTVHKLVSKMIVNEQLAGAWDGPSGNIVMHSEDLTRLQKAALRYAERASAFLEQNERLVEQRGESLQGGLGMGYGYGRRRWDSRRQHRADEDAE